MILCPPNAAPTLPLTRRSFSLGDRLPSTLNILWRIERGAVRTLTWNEQDIAVTLGYWGVGDVVGHELSRVKPYQIECKTSVEVSLLPPELWFQALDALILHIKSTEEFFNIACQHPLRQRLWQFLVFLDQKFGCDVEQGRLIDLVLTHQEIAEAVNATRVSVTRMLQQLEAERLLSRQSKRLILTRS
ncbi:MAG: Crp/Fnr family transcriptional regulator [Gloeocapsa sp. UFS-A4-WI-NPMV-4B04]|jgi:CRP-like cAMP-binding protein|nr:Crp/Fnr family transcriptional regulator [Gloeocapsa sp. UFS-A4-WI-NPMV-4B04]